MSDETPITISNFNKKHYLSRLKKFFEKSIYSCKLYSFSNRKEVEKNFKEIVKIISHEISVGQIFKDNYIKTYLQYVEGYLQYIRDYAKIVGNPSTPKSIVDSSSTNFLKYQLKFMEELKRRFIQLPCTTKKPI